VDVQTLTWDPDRGPTRHATISAIHRAPSDLEKAAEAPLSACTARQGFTLARRGFMLAPVSRGLVVSVAVAGACAASGSNRPMDPWAYDTRPDFEPYRPCPRAELIPNCPAGTERGVRVSESLLELEGQKVVVWGEPRVSGSSTALACPKSCCNAGGRGKILLCGGTPSDIDDCHVSVILGTCGGDSCRWCCSHNVEERPLVARGRLLRGPDQFPGGDDPGNYRGPRFHAFGLENPSLCYLDDSEAHVSW
jgi:hypothetical protein